jgi:plastocyanin domain-containing protein
MSALAVNAAGSIIIGFIVWWFWLSRPASHRMAEAPITIVVENGVYAPARIEITQGRPVTLRFLRKDPSPCAARVIFGELGISEELPIDKEREVHLEALPPGEYEFTCEMRMYRGSLLVT